MSYLVKVHRNGSLISGGGIKHIFGHTYLEFINTNSNELSQQVGFNKDKISTILDIITRLSIAGRVEYDREQLKLSVESRSFSLKKKDYISMLERCSSIAKDAKSGKTLYDLFDSDTNTSDFNCVTFAEHILRHGGHNIELGWFPDLVIKNTYNTGFWNNFYSFIEKISSLSKPASISFDNGRIQTAKEGWEINTTINSLETNIKAAYTNNEDEIAIHTDSDIEGMEFNQGLMHFIENQKIKKLKLNEETFNVSKVEVNELSKYIDSIDSKSFLLSNILIKTSEKILLGNDKFHLVQKNDTLSQIAQLNNKTTKQIVQLNPWLCSQERITFLYPNQILLIKNNL